MPGCDCFRKSQLKSRGFRIPQKEKCFSLLVWHSRSRSRIGHARPTDIFRPATEALEAPTAHFGRCSRGVHAGGGGFYLQRAAQPAFARTAAADSQTQLPGSARPVDSSARRQEPASGAPQDRPQTLRDSPQLRRRLARCLLRAGRPGQLLLAQGARPPDRHAVPAVAARRFAPGHADDDERRQPERVCGDRWGQGARSRRPEQSEAGHPGGQD